MRRNFDLSAVLVALGAVMVIVALFLEWYSPGVTAWDVFEVVDWALLALAIGALALIATEAAGALPAGNRMPWIAGAIGFLVLAEIIDAPPAVAGQEREIGAWIALAGGALMAVGVVLSLLRISVTIDVGDRQRRRRTAAVDARAGDEGGGGAGASRSSASGAGSGAGSGPEARSGSAEADEPGGRRRSSALWSPPSGDKPKGRVEGETAPSEAAPAAPEPGADDPDRTQPIPTTERPKRET